MNGTKQIKKDEGRRMKSQIRDQRSEEPFVISSKRGIGEG
jgi:hypothetical protein